eukprot:2681906-Rhodomonas_salina.2
MLAALRFIRCTCASSSISSAPDLALLSISTSGPDTARTTSCANLSKYSDDRTCAAPARVRCPRRSARVQSGGEGSGLLPRLAPSEKEPGATRKLRQERACWQLRGARASDTCGSVIWTTSAEYGMVYLNTLAADRRSTTFSRKMV